MKIMNLKMKIMILKYNINSKNENNDSKNKILILNVAKCTTNNKIYHNI